MRIKKAQTGKGVPKGYVKGEMTGKLIPEKQQRKHQADMAKAMTEAKMSDAEFAKYKAKQDSMKKKAPAKKMKSGGSFGMLSVKAGVDKNPKPTAADRIAGAKMNAGKSKSGGKVKMKKGGAMKKCRMGC